MGPLWVPKGAGKHVHGGFRKGRTGPSDGGREGLEWQLTRP